MIQTFEKIIFVFLGWLLATLSPIIADAIRRRRETKETKKALLAELSELRYRLAIVVLRIEQDLGRVDRTLLEFVKPVFSAYSGSMRSESIGNFVRTMIDATDDQIAALNAHTKKSSSSGAHLKSYPAPFLENRLKVVPWLPTRVQALMLEIHTQLSVFDAERANTEYYFRLTFSSGQSTENLAVIRMNMNEGYKNVSKVAQVIIQRINELEAVWS